MPKSENIKVTASNTAVVIPSDNGREVDTTAPVPQFHIKKILTLSLLKFVIDQPRYVQIVGEIFRAKEIIRPDVKKQMEAPRLANCVDLETGEICQIIVAEVLFGILTDEYPDHDYIQRAFMIKKGVKSSGKQYNPYSVSELELVDAPAV